jgi:hypothetical protein
MKDYSEADRAFFKRFPHRRYRLRRVYPEERKQIEEVCANQGHDAPFQPPPGVDSSLCIPCVGVIQLGPGLRKRTFFTVPPFIDLDLLSDEDCRLAIEEHWIPLDRDMLGAVDLGKGKV